MKKYFISFLLLLIAPSMCLGASARYTQLVREKQRKMEQLEKCMGASNGLKIAGVSTIGLTAVGVAANIAEAKTIKTNEKAIEKKKKEIESAQAEIAKLQEEKAKKDADAERKEKIKKEYNQSKILKTVALADIAAINAGGRIGDMAFAHGYQPEQLPSELSSKFATAMLGFIERCYQHKGQNGIKTVSAGAKTETNWRNLTPGEYTEDKILDNLNENIIAECKVETCLSEYEKHGNFCIKKSSDCTSSVSDTHVVYAEKNGSKCEIKKCQDGFDVSEDMLKCEEITIDEERAILQGYMRIKNDDASENDNYDNKNVLVEYKEPSEDEELCDDLGGRWDETNEQCTGLNNSDLSDENACWYEGGTWVSNRCVCPRGEGDFDPDTKTCKPVERISAAVSGLTVAPISSPEIKQINIQNGQNPGPYMQPTAMQQMLFAQ